MLFSATWMENVRSMVHQELTKYFEDKLQHAQNISPHAKEIVQAVAELTLRGGKRLRPLVAAAGYAAVNAEPKLEHIASVGAALELLQTYLLIHDDWMDADETRRGAPAVHVAFRERYEDAHLGGSLAILAGDLASAYAWEMLWRAPFAPEKKTDALTTFVHVQEEVVFGQQLDLLGYVDVAKVEHLKTGSYTVRGPLKLGALLGAATPEQIECLERFGAPLGVAFQLRDDLLGVFGNPEQTGKPIGNDLRAGKRNALILAAERRLSRAEQQELSRVFGNLQASESDLKPILELWEARGVRQEVETQLDALCAQARDVLREAAFTEAGKRLLGDVIGLLAQRNR